MAISGSAVGSAVSPAVNPNDLVNSPAGDPAQERWPGAVDPASYTDAGPEYPIEQPPAGTWMADQFGAALPVETEGGGVQDTSWMTGTDGPVVPWDSSAGQPFAPSGALNPDLHGQDTGAVYQAQHVVPAAIGRIIRRVITGQTFNRETVYDPATGQYVPVANGRQNLDQAQDWDPSPGDGGGYAPWDPGYAERPIMNNLAYEATPVTDVPSIYGVAGDLPDRSVYQDYAAQAYDAPADPIVTTTAAPEQTAGSGWMLG